MLELNVLKNMSRNDLNKDTKKSVTLTLRRSIWTLTGMMIFLGAVTSIVQAEVGWDLWNPTVVPDSDRNEYFVGDIVNITVHVGNHDPSFIAKDVDLLLQEDTYLYLKPIDSWYYSLGDLNPGESKEITVRAKAVVSGDVQVTARSSAIHPEDGHRYANLDLTRFKIKPKPDTSIPEFPGGLGIIMPIIGILIIVSKRKK